MENNTHNISRSDNKIIVSGGIDRKNTHYLLSQVYNAVEERGYKQIILDFEKCTAVPSSLMLSLCSYVRKYQLSEIDFRLVLPLDTLLRRLFVNSNWAHLISPEEYDISKFKGFKQVPATQYNTDKEQTELLNKIVNSLISSFSDLDRQAFAAVEWAMNEIMCNVLTHAVSPIGGIAQLTTYEKEKKRIEIIVADAGKTIPGTLVDPQKPDRDTPIKAIMAAINEGITSGVGLGNGLFGVSKICEESKGSFIIDSGPFTLIIDTNGTRYTIPSSIPISGTTVCATINCNVKNLLEKALRFGGRVHYTVDSIENKYEVNGKDHFLVADEAESVGNRPAGQAIRLKLKNLSTWLNIRMYIDFENPLIPSSSFLDEFLVKLIIEETPEIFKQKYTVINVTDTIINLLERSYKQRTNESILPVLNIT